MALKIEIARSSVQSAKAGYPYFWRVRGSWHRHNDYVLACGPAQTQEGAEQLAEQVRMALQPIFGGAENDAAR